jgi:hypothetical protein
MLLQGGVEPSSCRTRQDAGLLYWPIATDQVAGPKRAMVSDEGRQEDDWRPQAAERYTEEALHRLRDTLRAYSISYRSTASR